MIVMQESQRQMRRSRVLVEQDRVHVLECWEASSGIQDKLILQPGPMTPCRCPLPICQP